MKDGWKLLSYARAYEPTDARILMSRDDKGVPQYVVLVRVDGAHMHLKTTADAEEARRLAEQDHSFGCTGR